MKNNYTVYKNLFWKIMKVSTTQLMALLICFVAYAHDNVAQQLLETKVTVQLTGVSLKKALNTIEDAGNIKFVYSSNQLEVKQEVSIDASDEELSTVLDQLLDPINIDYNVQDQSNHIVLTPAKSVNVSYPGQDLITKPPVVITDMEISGKVTTEDGTALTGVNVIIKGSTSGTISDIDGNFRLTADSEDVLVFSFIGFATQEVLVQNRSVIDVILEEDISTLDEIVVVSTGYQELPKERATGSFSSADAEKLDAQVGVLDISEKFEGLLPGVLVSDGNISIRGQSTISATADPVIVLDGFPTQMSLSAINPNDVESITVLQDAAAASIWGVRASNGVIVITTKKGREGKKTQLTYTSSLRITDVPDIGDLRLANSSQYIDAELEAIDRGWVSLDALSQMNAYSPVYETAKRQHDGEISEAEANSIYDQFRQNNAYGQGDLFFEKGMAWQHNLSMSGATKKNNYYISLNYQDNEHYQIGNEDQRIKLMLKNSYQFHPKLRFDVQTTLSYIDSKSNGVYISQLVDQRPYEMIVDANGNYLPRYEDRTMDLIQDLESQGFYNWSFNLKQEHDNRDNSTSTISPRLITGLNWQIIDGLTFDTKFQIEANNSRNEIYHNEETYHTRNWVNRLTAIDGGGTLTHYLPQGTIFEYTNRNMLARTWRNQLSFNKEYGNGKHRIDAILGNEIYRVTTDTEKGRLHNYDRQLLTYELINDQQLAQGVSAYGGGNVQYPAIFRPLQQTENRYISYYFNGAYTFLDRYTFSASGRIDQSNLFGADVNDRIAPLYSVGLAWNVTNEKFFNVPGINFLKLRGTMGENGNVSRIAPKVLVGEAHINSYSTAEPYLKISSPENDELKWETTRTYNFGFDIGVLDNRLDLTLEYYKRNSSDVLGNALADPSLGFSTVFKNTSSITNKGIDLRVNGRVLTGAFNWDMGLNLTTNDNEVTDFFVAQPSLDYYLTGGYSRQLVGMPIDHLHALRWAGLNGEGHPQVYDHDGNIHSSEDVDLDPLTDWATYQGTTTPTYYGAFVNTFRYKGFRLNVIATYKGGNVMRYPNVYLRNSGEILAEMDQRWRQPGDEAHTDIPRMADQPNENYRRSQFYQESDNRVADASFIRLSNISLTYDFPNGLFGEYIRGLQLQAQMTNVALWTANDRDIDPEAIDRRSGNLNLSNPSVYTFGLKLDL